MGDGEMLQNLMLKFSMQFNLIIWVCFMEKKLGVSLNIKQTRLWRKKNNLHQQQKQIKWRSFPGKTVQSLKLNTPMMKIIENWRAQSKNDLLIFRPFLKVSTCQNSTTSEHFQKWPKNQGIVLALSPPTKPLTPKISLLVLLTVSQMILIMLVWRIWYWINK